jgi:hypothetical protein
MADPNGHANGDDKVRFWNDRAALLRHVWQFVACVVILTAGVVLTYATLAGGIEKIDDRSKSNEQAIEKLTGNVNSLTASQLLLTEQLKHDREKSGDFRQDTKEALKGILDELKDLNRRNRGTPR